MRNSTSRERVRTNLVGWCLFAAAACMGCASTLLFHGSLSGLLASATTSLSGTPVTVYFFPQTSSNIHIGDVTDVDIDINAAVPINAVGITVLYPKDSLEIIGISKQKSFFDLWTEDTVIKESSGELHFSGGTTRKGGLVGTSTMLTVSFRAKKIGDATVSVEDLQVYAADGAGTLENSWSRTLTITASLPTLNSSLAKTPVDSASSTIPVPHKVLGDFDGDGKVTLVDASILMLHMLMPYDPQFDLDNNGSIGFSDLSVLFAHMSSL